MSSESVVIKVTSECEIAFDYCVSQLLPWCKLMKLERKFDQTTVAVSLF